MEKWRYILGLGCVLGIVLTVIDYFIITIPYVIIIPLQIVAIILIFTGLVIRKNTKLNEK
ncbi:MAG: hypothetical protein IJE43_03290 [Alphaproteobacteria bacterium]|nr:hypothetical protein [Alphaproteobacteria bacterium]MBQ6995468.1 hypothetical protein [Lachnospiraceae bacterium]